jgi:hypothetical protein
MQGYNCRRTPDPNFLLMILTRVPLPGSSTTDRVLSIVVYRPSPSKDILKLTNSYRVQRLLFFLLGYIFKQQHVPNSI